MLLSKSLFPLCKTFPSLQVAVGFYRHAAELRLCALRALPLLVAFLLFLPATVKAQLVTPLEVTIEDASGGESTPVIFTVRLSRSPDATVEVTWTTSVEVGDTATAMDFTPGSGMLTFAAGATGPSLIQRINVATTDDRLAERDETFTMTLDPIVVGPGTEAMQNLPRVTATGTIQDSLGDSLAINVRTPAPVNEGETLAFQVNLGGSGELPAALTVAYDIEDGSATSEDFTDITGGTVTFPAGSSGGAIQDIRVMVIDDGLMEGVEQFTVRLRDDGLPTSRPRTGVFLVLATAMGTINASEARVDVSIAGGSAVEGEPVTFTVTLSDTPGADVQLQYSTSQGTAESPADFTAATDMELMTFAAGATGNDLTQTFTIQTAEDDLAEGDETFTVTLSARTGTTLPANVTLNPATATGTIRERENPNALGRVNAALLPHVAQAMMSNTLEAITGRLDAAAPGRPTGASAASPSGKANLLQALQAHERRLEDGTMDLAEALGDASFTLSLNAARAGAAPRTGDIALWGSGDYRRLSDPAGGVLDWDGDMTSFHLGADMRVRPDLLAGLAVSRAAGSFDYMDRSDPMAAKKGRYDSSMVSVHPYLGWTPDGDSLLWVTGSYGRGEIDIDERDMARHSSDTNMWMAAAGGTRKLFSDDSLAPGRAASLHLKGDGALARIETEGEGTIRQAEFDVQRLRVALEGRYECPSGTADGCLEPSLEAGVRHDGGDARTGTAIEIGGALHYTNRASGLTLELRGQVLAAGRDGYEDWSVGGQIVVDPGAKGLGLSFRLAPEYGNATDGIEHLYNRGVALLGENGDAAPSTGRLGTELGYGFVGNPEGVVTPYTGFSFAEEGTRRYRVGVRFEAGPSLGLSFEGMHRKSASAASDSSVMARGRLSW